MCVATEYGGEESGSLAGPEWQWYGQLVGVSESLPLAPTLAQVGCAW